MNCDEYSFPNIHSDLVRNIFDTIRPTIVGHLNQFCISLDYQQSMTYREPNSDNLLSYYMMRFECEQKELKMLQIQCSSKSGFIVKAITEKFGYPKLPFCGAFDYFDDGTVDELKSYNNICKCSFVSIPESIGLEPNASDASLYDLLKDNQSIGSTPSATALLEYAYPHARVVRKHFCAGVKDPTRLADFHWRRLIKCPWLWRDILLTFH